MTNQHPSAPKPLNYSKRFLLGIFLNLSFVIVEIIYGFRANSIALIADALHNAGDVLGLFIAWGGILLAQAKSPEKFTFGFKNTTVLTAFFNSIILLVAVGAISLEAVQRLSSPQMISSTTVIIVASIGAVINGLTAMLFAYNKNDINIRGAFLHMLGDAGISVGVVASSLLIIWTGYYWFDPVFSLVIAFFILLSCWGNLKESINLLLHAVPRHIDFNDLKLLLSQQKEIVSTHDLHVWAISTTETALALHVILNEGVNPQEWINSFNGKLYQKFSITHTTIQVDNVSTNLTCNPCECSDE
jgi:cobalt-zinc-cadmium efflux system protein